ncbi:hypothetical protein DPMN_183181 [Dreissena polymorpha]|uniref:Uncharacterized protein n=1 Tax=Dreissena polymorpha TaxID=45954 RepID=A0A9D4DGQ4_DREPO|nr:hypothetical protein DPMN_183181 [Dreissena polymorpha]
MSHWTGNIKCGANRIPWTPFLGDRVQTGVHLRTKVELIEIGTPEVRTLQIQTRGCCCMRSMKRTLLLGDRVQSRVHIRTKVVLIEIGTTEVRTLQIQTRAC